MAHRLVTAYREGRNAFPHTLLNPYAGMGDRAVARMWRLGRQRAAEESRGIPPEAERIERAGVEAVKIRSVLTCDSRIGVCASRITFGEAPRST